MRERTDISLYIHLKCTKVTITENTIYLNKKKLLSTERFSNHRLWKEWYNFNSAMQECQIL